MLIFGGLKREEEKLNTDVGFDRVTIVGPGLIGGSLGLALKAKGLTRHVTGVGRRETSLRAAQNAGAIDSATLNLVEGVKEADWVVLATRVGLVGEMALRAIPAMKPGAILSDVGSTKAEIVAFIEPHLRRDIHFVGTHPLAGSERRGVDAANAALFAGCICILTPTSNTDPKSLEVVSKIWQAIGARVVKMSPNEHDTVLAHVSHLPHLLAACLINSIPEDVLPFGAGGLRSTTRIAASDPELWLDILQTNRRNLLDALDRFENHLKEIRDWLCVDDHKALLAALTKAQQRRRSLEER